MITFKHNYHTSPPSGCLLCSTFYHSYSSGNIKEEISEYQMNPTPSNLLQEKDFFSCKNDNALSVNKTLPQISNSNVKLEQLHIPINHSLVSYGTPPMVIDSSGSSVSSSTYNSAEEGEYSNGACSGGTEDISTGVNPFVFDEHTFPSNAFSRNSYTFQNGLRTSDEYLCNNSLSSPSTSPPIQFLTNNTEFKKG